jgi:hypothetical protein
MMVDLFNFNELQNEGQHFVVLNVGVRDILGIMRAMLTLFKLLTNFTCTI